MTKKKQETDNESNKSTTDISTGIRTRIPAQTDHGIGEKLEHDQRPCSKKHRLRGVISYLPKRDDGKAPVPNTNIPDCEHVAGVGHPGKRDSKIAKPFLYLVPSPGEEETESDVITIYPPLTENEKVLIDEIAEMKERTAQADRLLVVYLHMLAAAQTVVSEALWGSLQGGVAKPLPHPIKPSDDALRALESVTRLAERVYNPWRDKKL